MAGTDSTSLAVALREPTGSRAVRRLRREGNVPGVVYGGGQDPVSFSINSRELRNALAHAGAVLDLTIDGQAGTPVVLKELVRHPVSGATMHVDLLRVRLDRPIQSTVVLELVGGDDAPGVKEGGILEHVLREITVEALPNDIPDALTHDVSGMEVAATLLLESLTAPAGVTIIGDPETVVATITAPRLQVESDTEIEAETAVVGDEAAAEGDSAEAAADGDGDGDAADAGE
ncbi:MAG TPA: 50S ribosomal protein L25 [Solirubrobacteraceae bacterium]|jgi:large subunit ribosomal protein L25|nr:50S ribosomal protein L25 [Solirubrobacteraceae bacterium]